MKSSEFAVLVLIRDPRTVRRWISGDNVLPQRVQDFLVEPVRADWP